MVVNNFIFCSNCCRKLTSPILFLSIIINVDFIYSNSMVLGNWCESQLSFVITSSIYPDYNPDFILIYNC